jgi:lysophospholipid acyltransferase
VASFFVTQLTFSFATTPFLVLNFMDSIRAWSRVYFYGAAGTMLGLMFFASPGKATLRKELEKRQGRASAKMVRSISSDSLTGRDPILGISKDLESDVTEAMAEIRAEVEARQKKSA